MRFITIASLFLCSLLTVSVASENNFSDPNQALRSLSENTFARLTAEEEKLEADPDYINVIIEEELIPYFDYKYAAYSVVGPNLKNTTAEQRNNFVEAFRTYLVNAYGHVLFQYDKQVFTILDNKQFKDKKIISIPVRMRDDNGQVTKLDFKLRKNKKTGQWKVFDVIAEGVSMLNTKRSELGALIQKKGIDEVTKLLLEKNSELKS